MKAGKIGMKNKKLLTGVFIVGLIILFGISHYTGIGYYVYPATPTEPQVVKLGHIAPLTGDVAIYGEWETQGIDLAVEEINAKGGINGRQLVVIHEDDQFDPATMTNALNKLITVDKVPAVIGEPSSTGTLALAPIAERNKVVLISDAAAAISISNAGEYIYRVFPSNALEGQKLVEISSSLNLTDGAILYINNDFGIGLAKEVNDRFVSKGGTISISEGYSPDATDFRTSLTKIKEKNPKAIFLLGYPKDMAMILKQARELGINSQFLAPDTFNDPQILEQAGSAAEGVIFVYPSNGDPAKWQQFSDKIKNKYGNTTDVNIITAMAYDTTNVLAAAMKNGFTGSEIKTGLDQIKDYPGVTGNITFDKNGDVVSRLMAVGIVKDGKFEEYK